MPKSSNYFNPTRYSVVIEELAKLNISETQLKLVTTTKQFIINVTDTKYLVKTCQFCLK